MYTGLVTVDRTPFFWSDLHFGHAKLLELGFRTGLGDSIEEHDELIIERWNNVLDKGDVGYILGDVSFRNKPDTLALLNRMNGRKFILFGNHDHTVKSLWKAQNAKPSGAIEAAYDYKEIRVGEQKICLMHFPILSFHQQHRGSWMLHGHCHSNLVDDSNVRRTDVGVDCFPNGPVSFEELQGLFEGRTGVSSDYVDHHVPTGFEL